MWWQRMAGCSHDRKRAVQRSVHTESIIARGKHSKVLSPSSYHACVSEFCNSVLCRELSRSLFWRPYVSFACFVCSTTLTAGRNTAPWSSSCSWSCSSWSLIGWPASGSASGGARCATGSEWVRICRWKRCAVSFFLLRLLFCVCFGEQLSAFNFENCICWIRDVAMHCETQLTSKVVRCKDLLKEAMRWGQAFFLGYFILYAGTEYPVWR